MLTMPHILAISIALMLGGQSGLEAQTTGRGTIEQSEKPGVPLSRIESFLRRSGRVVVAERYLAARVPDPDYSEFTRLELHAVIAYEAGKPAERLKGVEVEVQRGTGQLPNTILLDLDSASAVSLAIAQLKELSTEQSRMRTEMAGYTAAYSTANGFTIAVTLREIVLSMPATSTHMPLSSVDTLQAAFQSAVKTASSK